MSKATKVKDEYLDLFIGLYRNQYEKGAGIEITIRDWFKGIESNKEWAAYCAKVRALALKETLTDKEKKTFQDLKDMAPAVTPAGNFTDKGNPSSLKRWTGLMAMDLDSLLGDLEDIRARLKADPYVYVIFQSISGRGLCVLFKVDDLKRYVENFEGIRDYLMSNYGLVAKQADKLVKNLNRIRYISSDPGIYYNADSKVARIYQKKADEKRYTPPKNIIHSDDDIEFVVRQIEARQIEFHDGGSGATEGDWFRAGLALASKYGSDGFHYFDRISQFRHDYDQAETQKKYEYLCRNARGTINIATFYHIAKQLGCSVMSEPTRAMVSVAAMHKKQKAGEDETVNTLVTMLRVDEDKAKNIVSQVFAITESIDTEEDVYDQLRAFLGRNYPMKRNVITRHLENEEGKPYLEETINSIYFEVRKHVGDVSFQDYLRMIYSDWIPDYDPFTVFFNTHKHRTPSGNIDKLARSIKTKSDVQPAYVRVWLEKWLLGIIGTMLGSHSPICLVLSGGINKGKTQFFRRLLPYDLNREAPFTSYFGESELDKGQDDEILMCKKLILFNDEFGGKNRHDQKRFKNLTSKQTFSIREPYLRQHKDLRRIAVLCGSCNETDILDDPTGNRRIVPIHIEGIDFELYNSIDKTDLLIEAYNLFLSGKTCDVTADDIKLLNDQTEEFEAVCLERELLDLCFTKPKTLKDRGAYVWKIAEILFEMEPRTKKHIDLKRLEKEIKRAGFVTGRSASKRGYVMIKNFTELESTVVNDDVPS